MFTDDFKDQPYWWDAAAPEDARSSELPKTVDVLVIGSGYTGLHAALRTARAGRSTLVLEAEALGHGASSRNGGQVSTSIKPDFAALKRRYGEDTARGIIHDAQASLNYFQDFIAEEGIDCHLRVPGRFHGAHTAGQYDKLAAYVASMGDGIDTEAFMVPRADQHAELGTDAYYGGIVFPKHASVHPALYHKGLRDVVRKAGAQMVSHCRVTAIDRQAPGFRVRTERGEVMAKRVIVATNGYTTGLTPWQQRRVIPIGSYIIATEELPKAQMDRLIPTNRVLSDTRKLVVYYRPSPDRKRILFGGRVSLKEMNPTITGPRLKSMLVALFPELETVKISYSWSGYVGYTFDTLMHCGQDDGLYYAMGYCGSGVGMASYLGMKIGLQAADDPAGETAFGRIPFPTRPFYTGNPWFLAPSIMVYRFRDRFGI
ncbi:FAD-binding oxidoreductase [Pseudohalocynthiibacter aestuariivivens]|nr:FAD-binding oxidoreductase [Pseudohalocynthiibacter aestuariivivens]QIE47126.1 FAD-binding oxidoreductase [Pseudohalocynthiibacter aestuariivivens]